MPETLVADVNGSRNGTGSSGSPVTLAEGVRRKPELLIVNGGHYRREGERRNGEPRDRWEEDQINGRIDGMTIRSANQLSNPPVIHQRVDVDESVKDRDRKPRLIGLHLFSHGEAVFSAKKCDDLSILDLYVDQVDGLSASQYTWTGMNFEACKRLEIMGLDGRTWHKGDLALINACDCVEISDLQVDGGLFAHSFIKIKNSDYWRIVKSWLRVPADRAFSITAVDGRRCRYGLVEDLMIFDSNWDGENPPAEWYERGDAGAPSPARFCAEKSIFRNFAIVQTHAGKNTTGAWEFTAYTNSDSFRDNDLYNFVCHDSAGAGFHADRNPRKDLPRSRSANNRIDNFILSRCGATPIEIGDREIDIDSWKIRSGLICHPSAPVILVRGKNGNERMTIARAMSLMPEVFANLHYSENEPAYANPDGNQLADFAVPSPPAGTVLCHVTDATQTDEIRCNRPSIFSDGCKGWKEPDAVLVGGQRRLVKERVAGGLILDEPVETRQGEAVMPARLGLEPKLGLFPSAAIDPDPDPDPDPEPEPEPEEPIDFAPVNESIAILRAAAETLNERSEELDRTAQDEIASGLALDEEAAKCRNRAHTLGVEAESLRGASAILGDEADRLEAFVQENTDAND